MLDKLGHFHHSLLTVEKYIVRGCDEASYTVVLTLENQKEIEKRKKKKHAIILTKSSHNIPIISIFYSFAVKQGLSFIC